MYFIDIALIDGKYFNLVYDGSGTYSVLEGNKPTDIKIKASTQAEATSKFHAIMNAYR